MANKEAICKLYMDGLTTREVAAKLGCGKTTVSKLIKDVGISRPKVIRMHVLEARAKKCRKLSQKNINFLDGLIISDGCYMRPRSEVTKTTLFGQTSVNLPWLKEISQVFDDLNIAFAIAKENRKIKKNNGWSIRTNRYDQLYKQYCRWYPNGEKRVPKDIDLSNKRLLKNWVYGDGTLLNGRTLRFCTDSFSKDDIDFLIEKINSQLGVEFKTVFMGLSKGGKPKLRLTLCKRDGLKKFYDYVGYDCLDCFKYKWEIK